MAPRSSAASRSPSPTAGLAPATRRSSPPPTSAAAPGTREASPRGRIATTGGPGAGAPPPANPALPRPTDENPSCRLRPPTIAPSSATPSSTPRSGAFARRHGRAGLPHGRARRALVRRCPREQVTLPPAEPLGPVVAAFRSPHAGPPTPVPLSAWLSITAPLGSQSCPSASRNEARRRSWAWRSRPSRRHLRQMVVDGLPRRVLSEEHPPGAAAPEQVEDGIRHAPDGPFRGTAAPLGGLEEGLKQGPLRIREVGGIRVGAGHGDLLKLESDAP